MSPSVQELIDSLSSLSPAQRAKPYRIMMRFPLNEANATLVINESPGFIDLVIV